MQKDKTTQKNIIVIGRRDDRVDRDSPMLIVHELNKTAHSAYSQAALQELLFIFDGTKLQVFDGQDQDISVYDGIFFIGWFKDKMLEDVALAITMYAREHDVPFLNAEAGLNRSCSKLSQCVAAVLHGVQTMPFVFAQDADRLLVGVDRLKLEYPIIVKAVRSDRGKNNYLVTSLEELEGVLAEQPDTAFIAQKFIPNDGDYRIIVMGDRVRFIMHRVSSSDSHLNNTSQGGIATQLAIDALPPVVIEQSITIAKALHRDIGGVDMIIDKNTGKHYFLEANIMPQLSTGSLVEAKMAKIDEFLTEWVEGK